MGEDDARDRILERRARFAAALVAGIGASSITACPTACLKMPLPERDAGTTDGDAASGPEAGARETLTGVARDGKGGPAIVVDGTPVYVRGLDAWPAGWVGERVEVTGVVITRPGLPEPAPGEPAIGGIVGPYRVIEDATWRLVE